MADVLGAAGAAFEQVVVEPLRVGRAVGGEVGEMEDEAGDQALPLVGRVGWGAEVPATAVGAPKRSLFGRRRGRPPTYLPHKGGGFAVSEGGRLIRHAAQTAP